MSNEPGRKKKRTRRGARGGRRKRHRGPGGRKKDEFKPMNGDDHGMSLFRNESEVGSDLRLVERAIAQKWKIPDALRARLPQRLERVALNVGQGRTRRNSGSYTVEQQLKAVQLLVKMKQDNDKMLKNAIPLIGQRLRRQAESNPLTSPETKARFDHIDELLREKGIYPIDEMRSRGEAVRGKSTRRESERQR